MRRDRVPVPPVGERFNSISLVIPYKVAFEILSSFLNDGERLNPDIMMGLMGADEIIIVKDFSDQSASIDTYDLKDFKTNSYDTGTFDLANIPDIENKILLSELYGKVDDTLLIVSKEIAQSIILKESESIAARIVNLILASDETVVRHAPLLDETFLDIITMGSLIESFKIKQSGIDDIKGMIE